MNELIDKLNGIKEYLDINQDFLTEEEIDECLDFILDVLQQINMLKNG